jgi:DNA end-binding protein Ku
LQAINPLLFYKPYFMEAQKGGEKAYSLLRDALETSGKIGIAKVVIKVRQHLAALKSQQNCLMLELMHFPDELLPVSEIKSPGTKTTGKPEMKMATQLINSMTTDWKPEMYHDEYHEALEKLIEEKIVHGARDLPVPKRSKSPTKAVDLVSILQQSIQRTRGRNGGKALVKGIKGRGRNRLQLSGRHHRN